MTMLTEDQINKLKGKLNPEHVSKRRLYGNSGPELSYIEAWFAIAEANDIFGFDGWDSETVDLIQTNCDQNGDKWYVGYLAKCKVTVGRCVREGTGFGTGIAKGLGDAIESAAKEAESDARKRALMTFGNKFGLALYDKTQANVGYDEGQTPSPAYQPAKGGGYKDAKGYTNGQMNSAGKRATIEEITQDLLDCHSTVRLEKLQKEWKPTLEKWKSSDDDTEYSWFKLALELFDAKKQEVAQHPIEGG